MRDLTFVVVLSLGIVGTVAVVAQVQSPYPPAKPQAVAPRHRSSARGAQLAMLGGCDDCHTPKLAGGALNVARRLSGFSSPATLPPEVAGAIVANPMMTAWRGPWGVTLAANITPDKQTGIGTWTLADFVKTMRTGVDPRGHVVKPPMPIAGFQNLPAADLDAVFRFLKTVKPIHNEVGRAE
jgi:hypothetical protein